MRASIAEWAPGASAKRRSARRARRAFRTSRAFPYVGDRARSAFPRRGRALTAPSSAWHRSDGQVNRATSNSIPKFELPPGPAISGLASFLLRFVARTFLMLRSSARQKPHGTARFFPAITASNSPLPEVLAKTVLNPGLSGRHGGAMGRGIAVDRGSYKPGAA